MAEHGRTRTRERTRATKKREPRMAKAQGCRGSHGNTQPRSEGREGERNNGRRGEEVASGQRKARDGQIGRGKSGVAAQVLSTLN